MESQRARQFKILADEGRLQILQELMASPLCVNDLAGKTRLSQNLISHHLRILRDANMVDAERRGKNMIYKLSSKFKKSSNHLGIDLGCCRIQLRPKEID